MKRDTKRLLLSVAALIAVSHVLVYFSTFPRNPGDTYCGFTVIWLIVAMAATFASFAVWIEAR